MSTTNDPKRFLGLGQTECAMRKRVRLPPLIWRLQPKQRPEHVWKLLTGPLVKLESHLPRLGGESGIETCKAQRPSAVGSFGCVFMSKRRKRAALGGTQQRPEHPSENCSTGPYGMVSQGKRLFACPERDRYPQGPLCQRSQTVRGSTQDRVHSSASGFDSRR